MVDLVKLRKKKAEREKAKGESEPKAQPAAELPQQPSNSATQQPEETPDNPTPRHPDNQPSKLDKFKEQAGKRREVAKTAEIQTTTAQLELLTFVMAGEQYAVDIERIIEIVTPRPLTRIPNADPSVLGIISLRGTIVTLVDVRRKLRHAEAGDATDDTRIVVIDFHHEIIGFIVDRVLRVVKVSAGDVERHPVVHATEQIGRASCR